MKNLLNKKNKHSFTGRLGCVFFPQSLKATIFFIWFIFSRCDAIRWVDKYAVTHQQFSWHSKLFIFQWIHLPAHAVRTEKLTKYLRDSVKKWVDISNWMSEIEKKEKIQFSVWSSTHLVGTLCSVTFSKLNLRGSFAFYASGFMYCGKRK